jgi:predicted metalloprotease
MRWKDQRRSENIEDRRGLTPAGIAIGGGIGALIIALIAIFLGADPRQVMNLLQQNNAQLAPNQKAGPVEASPEEEEQKEFVSTILADTEDVWSEVFRRANKEYKKPTLVLFRRQVESACGLASSAVGPFYCPGDQKVYLDLAFFAELERRFRAPGEFARAYVVAHEVGHHVQNLLGISDEVHAKQQRLGGGPQANQLSVRLELQADFLAGVWANHANKARHTINEADIEDGINAAQAIGDDTLQREAQGRVMPDSFTHGSSAQRVAWFRKGLRTGDLNQGDTFGSTDP